LRLLESADRSPRTISASLPQSEAATAPGTGARPVSQSLVFDEDQQKIQHAPEQSFPLLSEPENLVDIPAVTSDLFGEPTQAAGLYFLLPVLRHLGIASVLDSCPALQQAGFPEHILRRLAAQCRVAPGDSILTYLQATPPEAALATALPATGEDFSVFWPANMPSMPGLLLDSHALLRIWTLAVRRWCWRMGRLTPAAIVLRTGEVFVTRAELDITLPLDLADVRIRRLGLDIDPGWLPWFGTFGTVVRFHYREQQPGRPTS
jgi:hypothetical protein